MEEFGIQLTEMEMEMEMEKYGILFSGKIFRGVGR